MTDLWSGRFKAAVLAVLPLALMVLGTKIFMSDVPLAIYLQGVVEGLMLALIALGFVIVYRANRIINFSAADLGNAPATFAFLLFGSLGWNLYLSMFIGLASAVVLGVLVEFIFLRRFFTAPRLIMTVATIGVTQLLVALALLLPQWLGSSDVTTYQAIINVNFSVGVVPFGGADVMVLLVVPICFVLLAAFFRYSAVGVALRATCRERRPRLPARHPGAPAAIRGVGPRRGPRVHRDVPALRLRPEHRRRPRSRDSSRRPRCRRDRAPRTYAHGGARRSRPRHRATSGDLPLSLERLRAGVDRPGDRDRAPRPTRRHGLAPREFGHLDVERDARDPARAGRTAERARGAYGLPRRRCDPRGVPRARAAAVRRRQDQARRHDRHLRDHRPLTRRAHRLGRASEPRPDGLRRVLGGDRGHARSALALGHRADPRSVGTRRRHHHGRRRPADPAGARPRVRSDDARVLAREHVLLLEHRVLPDQELDTDRRRAAHPRIRRDLDRYRDALLRLRLDRARALHLHDAQSAQQAASAAC